MSHPYLDLATFSNFANLSDDDAIGLLAVQERSFHAVRNLSRAIYVALFLRLVPDLSDVHILTRDETPTLRDCYARLRPGDLDPKTPNGQAMLRQAAI